jgi:hypothetical protein
VNDSRFFTAIRTHSLLILRSLDLWCSSLCFTGQIYLRGLQPGGHEWFTYFNLRGGIKPILIAAAEKGRLDGKLLDKVRQIRREMDREIWRHFYSTSK